MSRTIEPPQCIGCHFATYTKPQTGYAEEHGTPLAVSSFIFCQIKREYTFKNDSCKNYQEKHEQR